MKNQKVFGTVFKAAFAAGMGFTIGKTFGGFCNTILDEGVYANVLRFLQKMVISMHKTSVRQ